MLRYFLAGVCCWTLVGSAVAELKFTDVVARNGAFGPPRESDKVVPGDEYLLSWMLRGASVNEQGRVVGTLKFEVFNKDGVAVLDRSNEINELLAFAGDSFPGVTDVSFGLKTPPGDYKVKVTFTDKKTEKTVAHERTVTVLNPQFGLVRPRFSFDQEGKIPANLNDVVLGRRLHFSFLAVGYDRALAKIDLGMELQIFDAAGKPLMPKPLGTATSSADAEIVAKTEAVPFSGFFSCNSPGNFKVKITLIDKAGDKSTTFECPLTVTAMPAPTPPAKKGK